MCLYSAASMLERSLSAAAQSVRFRSWFKRASSRTRQGRSCEVHVSSAVPKHRIVAGDIPRARPPRLMTVTNRSPLKDLPLRLPGQSLEEERSELLNDKLEPWLLCAALFIVLAALEWWRYVTHALPSPVVTSLAALVVTVLAGWRVYRLRPRLKALRLGIQGEKAVGQYLEELRAAGYAVFHDVIADGFNIDHVLIGPAGIFAVETKTWSKPTSDAEIHFDGDRLMAGSFAPDRDPVAQAQGTARWLAAELRQSTGKELDVWPVVLFPGWYVRQSDTSLNKCWVLEPKAFPKFLSHRAESLRRDDVKLAAYHLSRFVRVSERERVRA